MKSVEEALEALKVLKSFLFSACVEKKEEVCKEEPAPVEAVPAVASEEVAVEAPVSEQVEAPVSEEVPAQS